MRAPVIHLYTLCWNDAAIIPHFLDHYAGLVDRIVVLDNGSTDGSIPLLQACPFVTLQSFEVPAEGSFVLEEQRISDRVWHASRDQADWVFVLDMDELLFHPNLPLHLSLCAARGITALRSIGFDMVADAMPDPERPLLAQVGSGVRSLGYDKICMFNPNAIVDSGFTLGRHNALPTGDVRFPARPMTALLHYKHLGLDYMQRRTQELATGLRALDLKKGYGRHYLRSKAEMAGDHARMQAAAEPVPGLAGGAPFELLGANEHTIRCSSRFDGPGYAARYYDVAAAMVDPAAHFHLHGWREGRLPSADPGWRAFKAAVDRVAHQPRTNPYMDWFL